jgi:hypothetical protein
VTLLDDDEPANHPPRVAIISPPDGTVFPAPPRLTIVASAHDTDGHVASVEFFADGTSLGKVEADPIVGPIPLDDSHPELGPISAFRITWPEPPPGVHVLTAVAVDDDGAQTTSEPVEIKILEVAPIPVVTVVATDAEGAEVSPNSAGTVERNPAVFTVRRTGSTEHALDVHIRLGGTAQNGVDYTEVARIVTIPAGASSADVVIAPIDDNLAEGNERVVLALAPLLVALPADLFPWPVGPYLIGRPAEAAAVILDNDEPANLPPVVELIHPHDGEVFRAHTTIQLIAAAADRDGEVVSVEFFAGDRRLGEGVPTAGLAMLYKLRWDDVPAGDYAITAVATDNDGGSQTSRAAEIKVVEFHPPTVVTIETVDGEAQEPNPNTDGPTNPARFKVMRDGSTDHELTVYYKLSGTAENGVDYAELPMKATIPAGADAVDIAVDPLPDERVEGPETVVVVLAPLRCAEDDHPEGIDYIVGPPGMARAVILDDDSPANLPPRVAITEPDHGQIFRGPQDIKVLVAARDADGWVGLVQLYAGDRKIGEQAIVFIQPPEPGQDQTFEFLWEDVEPGHYVLRAKATDDQGAESWSGPVGILVTEPHLPTVVSVVAADPLAVEPGTDEEANPGAFLIHRKGDLSIPLPVLYAVGGTAENGEDYEELVGEVTIPEGAESVRVPVKPLADNLAEEIETVVLEIVEPACIAIFPPPPECYTAGEMRRAVVHILDRRGSPNRPPRVELVRPNPGDVFQAPAEVKLVAMAKDGDGHVVKVEFFADGEKIGEQMASNLTLEPANVEASGFTFVWSDPPVGRHLLHAVATDDDGASTKSQEVPILVIATFEPPVVRIVATDPYASERTEGGHVNTATFKVHRTGRTNGDLVVFYSVRGTAEPGSDYEELPGQVVIPAGQRWARITIEPLNDDVAERTETVVIELEPSPALSPIEPYRIGWPAKACAVIADNDEPPPVLARPLPEEVFHVCLPGERGLVYRIEASGDLLDWIPVHDAICEDGYVRFAEPSLRELGHRFYRIRPVVVEALDLGD